VSVQRDTLRPLTALRFIAALSVVSWHCVQTRVISSTFSLGYIGVAFFFLLSGFILTYTYHDAFRERLRAGDVRSFYVARFARVYPLHIVMMPPMIAAVAFLGPHALWNGVEPHTRMEAIAAQVALLQSWFPVQAIYFGANAPSWSISVEALFYVLFPLLAVGLLRLFRGVRAHTVLFFAALLWLAQSATLWPQHAGVGEWCWYVFPPSRLVDFVVGMMLGIAFLAGDREKRWPLRGTSVEILAVTAVFLAICFSPYVPVSMRFSAWFMPASGALILVFAHRRGAISHLLSHPVMVRLGEVSFAFYLCHLAVIEVVRASLGWLHPAFIPLVVGGSLAMSFALYHGVEAPLRLRIRSWFSERTVTLRTSENVPLALAS
jgi:peptidoglycan/LPS O-acetylase OafA/YrhL